MGKKKKRSRSKETITFDAACAVLERTLRGTDRQQILSEISKSKSLPQALLYLRESMRGHLFRTGSGEIKLHSIVNQLDRRTRRDGFRVLHDWDGKAERLNEESIPVDVLNFLIDAPGAERSMRAVLAILLDYYFLYVLALFSLRAWDEGSAGENLDRLSRLLQDLQGPSGSGQKFVANIETLILIAVSHFEPDETAYDRLLEKVRTLEAHNRTNMAIAHAAILASHLRFGFEATYGRDTIAMRNDNGPDYPWLCLALSTLMEAYARLHQEGARGIEREKIVEGLVNGLSPDARAFVGTPPPSLAPHEAERSEFAELFRAYRIDLLEEFERHRPSVETYSPIAFYFNFSHNILKAIVVDALLRGDPWKLTLNDLLTGLPRDERLNASRETLVQTLMGYARSSPDTIRGRLVPAIIYDPRKGLRAFNTALDKLKE